MEEKSLSSPKQCERKYSLLFSVGVIYLYPIKTVSLRILTLPENSGKL